MANAGLGFGDRAMVAYVPSTMDLYLWRLSEGAFRAGDWNMPDGYRELRRRVIWHSPDGYNWGYHGSGPADLALNILDHMIPPGMDGRVPLAVFDGWIAPTICPLYQELKRVYLANMPEEGGKISGMELRAWVQRHLGFGWQWVEDHFMGPGLDDPQVNHEDR